MKTAVGAPEPLEPEFFRRVQTEFQALDQQIARMRAAIELSRSLAPRVFPSRIN